MDFLYHDYRRLSVWSSKVVVAVVTEVLVTVVSGLGIWASYRKFFSNDYHFNLLAEIALSMLATICVT